MAEHFRKQHIVPQAYLNRFAKKQDTTYVIGTRLNGTESRPVKLFTSPVADVAYKENYYDTTKQADPKYWEHFLGKTVDTLCGRPLENIVSKLTLNISDDFTLTPDDIHTLAQIVFAQIVRVPGFLNHEMGYAEELVETYMPDLVRQFSLTTEQRAEIEEWWMTKDALKNVVLSSAFDKDRFDRNCSALEKKIWIIFYNGIRQHLPFITSDNPVLLYDTKRQPVLLTDLGLESNRLVIMFPLTPSLLVGIYPTSMYLGKLNEFDRKRIVLTEKDEKFIMDLTTEQIARSRVHSFLPEPLFSMVKGAT